MTIFESPTLLEWGALDVPLLGLEKDWLGNKLDVPAAFSLALDSQRLWFIASHQRAAALHPASRPGRFCTELWKYDVAELWLSHPQSGRYFEFNLAPNGAWWSCEFRGPREREERVEIAMPEVAAFSELAPDGSWVAALALPLPLLKARLDFGPETLANVTFVLESPDQRLLTAADLGGGEPDFHRPAKFRKIVFSKLA